MPATSLSVLVVAHTHWDREWYHTAERFRQRLVALVDELIDDPPANGASFLLDGQGVVLDDYLAVRPERVGELSALLRDGRIEAGPWYVLADELIPSGEALVRNLREGRDTVRRLRGEPPPVLYCPDSFGHPAILPELAAGFGCGVVILWRGYGGRRWPMGDTAHWSGPSGASVVLGHLPPAGYEFGSSLPVEAAAAASRWAQMRATLLPRATTGTALLLNGADHHARQRDQAHAVALMGDVARDATIRPASLADAGHAIVQAAASVELPAVTGELRDSYGYTWTLGGTLGTRAAQKRRNAIAERTLVRDVEPWVALGAAGRNATARALLRAVWRDLLLAHPHDTLCGTSIDAVADAFEQRLASVESQADGLRRDAIETLATHDAEDARHRHDEWRPALLLRNPAARTRSGIAEILLTRRLADVAVGPGSAMRQGARATLDDSALDRLGMQVVARREMTALTESPRAYPDADLVEETRALAWVPSIGGYAVECHPLEGFDAHAAPHPVTVRATSIDNGLLQVQVASDGRVTVEDRMAARAISDAIGFELHRDVGDCYTPAIRAALAPPPFVACEVTCAGPLHGELALRFADDAGNAHTMCLQLDAGLAALRIVIDGVSTRADARLRLRVGADLTTVPAIDRANAGDVGDGSSADARHGGFGGAPRAAMITTIADAAFHPVARHPLLISAHETAIEQVVPTAPCHRFVSRYAIDRGLTLISDGLAEYHSLDDGGLAVTLVRSIGELSRHDLPERPGHAGWPASTPGAQSVGPWSARFALALHGADSAEQRDAVERLAEDVLLPITGETLRSNLSGRTTFGGLELTGEGLAFSCAMPARTPGWIVLRCVNRRVHPVQGTWRLDTPVHEARRARLDETCGETLHTGDGIVAFTAAPMEIVTILVKTGTEDAR